MKTKEIGLYTTYQGADGTERRVVGFTGNEKCESVIWLNRKLPKLQFISSARQFARWAKKEVK